MGIESFPEARYCPGIVGTASK